MAGGYPRHRRVYFRNDKQSGDRVRGERGGVLPVHGGGGTHRDRLFPGLGAAGIGECGIVV